MGGGSAYGNAMQVKKSEGQLVFGGSQWTMQNASRNIIQIRSYLADVKESPDGALLIPGCYCPEERTSATNDGADADEEHELAHQQSDVDAGRDTFARHVLVSSTLQASCRPVASVAPEDRVSPLEQLHQCIKGAVPVEDASVFHKRHSRHHQNYATHGKRPNVSGPPDTTKKRVRFM